MQDIPKINVDEPTDTPVESSEQAVEVELACFSSDGSRVLMVQNANQARITNTHTREDVATLTATSALSGTKFGAVDFHLVIEAAALNPTGEYALLGFNDGTAGVFSVTTGERICVLRGPGEFQDKWELVRAVDFSQDGSMIIVGFYNRCVGIWNSTGDSLICYLEVPDGNRCYTGIEWARQTLVSSVAITPDNRYAFAGFADMSCAVWEIASRELVFSAFQHVESVLSMNFSPDSMLWATSGGNIWLCNQGKSPERVLSANQNWQEVEFSSDKKSLICRTANNSIYRWYLDGKSELLKNLEDVSWPLSARTIGFFDRGVYYVSSDSEVQIEGDKSRAIVKHGAKITHAIANFHASQLLTEGWSDKVEVWDIATGKKIGNIEAANTVLSLALSLDGRYLAVSTAGDGTKSKMSEIEVWDLFRLQRVFRWRAHHGQVGALAFGPKSNRLASASLDGTVRLWQLGGFLSNEIRELAVVEPPNLDASGLYVLKDGRIIISASGSYEIWSPDLKTRLCCGDKKFGWHLSWAVDEEHQQIVVAEYGQRIHRMSISTESGTTIEPEIDRPRYFPDVELARKIGAVAVAYVWDAPGGPYLHVGEGPRGWVTLLTFSNNRTEILLPCINCVKLLRINNGEATTELEQISFSGKFRAGCITDNQIMAVNDDGEIFFKERAMSSSS